MKVGLATICFNEERLIKPFLSHLPDWIDRTLVLVSTKPWYGSEEAQDTTADIAREMGAEVVEAYWTTEEQQRNTGQALLNDCDWVITLDPDEFLDNENWEKLRLYLEESPVQAAVANNQRVFWRDKEVYPGEDHTGIICARPQALFVDKRVIGTSYDRAPVDVLHFSWARTDEEVWRKISHYAHVVDFDVGKWYKDVWLARKTENMHPITPESMGGLIDAKLPPEIAKLGLLEGLV